MYFLNILRSLDTKHWYIGSTSDIPKRLVQHNAGNTPSTRPFKPWRMVYFEEFKTKSEACKREFYLKSPKGYLEYRQIKNKITGEVA